MAYPANVGAAEDCGGGYTPGGEEPEDLYQLAHDLARADDSATMADLLFTHTLAVLGAEYGLLLRANADGSVLQGVTARGVPSERARQEQMLVKDESSSAALAFRTQQPIIVPDLAAAPRTEERLRHMFPLLRSVWVVPLMSGKRAVGTLSVGFAAARPATTAEIRLLQWVGDVAAMALDRARITEQLSALQKERREHQQTTAKLRETEEQYRELVENGNDVIYAQDEDGRFTYVSPVIEPLSGYHPSELLGRLFDDFIHPTDLPALRASAQRTLAGQLEPSEFRVRLKSGEWRWVRSSSRPIVREGRVCGLRGMVTDITDRKQAEAHAAALLEVAKDVSGTLDRDELLARVQRRMATVLPCDIVATFFWDPSRAVFRLLSQYGLPPSTLPLAEALVFPPEEPFRGQLSRGEAVVINEVQTQPWLPVDLLTQFGITALVAVPLRIRGRELGTLVACTTNTRGRFSPEQVELCYGIARQVAVALEVAYLYHQQQEETEVATMLAKVGRALLAPLNTVHLLEQLCRLTSEALGGSWSCTLLWRPEEAVYRIVASWGYPALQRERLERLTVPAEEMARLLTAFAVDDVLELNWARRGELLPAVVCQELGLGRALCVRLQRGQEIRGFLACGYEGNPALSSRQVRIARGIAQLASLALANAYLVDELTQANQIKEDFMGLMSHELRTPLNIILGYTQLLLEETFGKLTPEQVDTLERIARNSRELLELITATLDLSRLQNQQRQALALREVDVTTLLTELANESQHLPHRPTVRIHWHLHPQLPRLRTDVLKLKMVLKNLLTNALKFTEEGTVTVSASPQQAGIELRVSDTGRGIAREALPVIFEPFQQVEYSQTPHRSGVGLGLYIVRQVVMLLGGRIHVESEVGQGSTFSVWLPESLGEGA